MKKSLFLLSIVVFLSATGYAQSRVADSIKSHFMADTSLRNAAISMSFVETTSSKVIMETTPQLCLTPASIQKLATTAAALDILGKDFCFETKINARGCIKGHCLEGDLVVIGGGDPTLGSKYFASTPKTFLTQWAAKIKGAGIDTIKGSIITDESIFIDNEIPSTWIWEDIGQYYGAAATGISIYDNIFSIFFTTGNIGTTTKVIRTYPEIPGLTINNEVIASGVQRDNAYVFSCPNDCCNIDIRGSLPHNRKSFSIKSSIPQPATLLVYDFTKAMKDAGITIENNKTFSTNKYSNKDLDSTLFINRSPKLTEIIKVLNYNSVNLFAEALCKQIGLSVKGEGSTQAGVDALKKYWETKGIEANSFFLADGSGLSRFNATTAKAITDVLLEAKKTDKSGYFEESLPIAGRDGTMLMYFTNSVLKQKAHIKSGSMTRVRSFAGYMTTMHGNNIAFSVIVNNFGCSGSVMASKLEKLLEDVYLKL